VLVLLDLTSGYIFVKSYASDRQYETWHARVQQSLGQAVEVKYLVSDRAKALVKLALVGLGCRSIPDLFHADSTRLHRLLHRPAIAKATIGFNHNT
jgi:hypothetical protein